MLGNNKGFTDLSCCEPLPQQTRKARILDSFVCVCVCVCLSACLSAHGPQNVLKNTSFLPSNVLRFPVVYARSCLSPRTRTCDGFPGDQASKPNKYGKHCLQLDQPAGIIFCCQATPPCPTAKSPVFCFFQIPFQAFSSHFGVPVFFSQREILSR